MIEHWLYGKIELVEELEEESDCTKCIHEEVCRILTNYDKMDRICTNYKFGCSGESECSGCVHRYARLDRKQPIKCFKCKRFVKKLDETAPFVVYSITEISEEKDFHYTDDWGEWIISKNGKTITLSSDEAKELFNQMKPSLMG